MAREDEADDAPTRVVEPFHPERTAMSRCQTPGHGRRGVGHVPIVHGYASSRSRASSSPAPPTEKCVVQSAIEARKDGFKVTILADACATTDERME
jgi:hypothetical protein